MAGCFQAGLKIIRFNGDGVNDWPTTTQTVQFGLPMLPDGYYAEIVPLTFGRARIIVTDGHQVEDGW